MKYPEFILAVRRSVLRTFPALACNPKGFVTVNWPDFSSHVQRGTIIGQREDLDEAFNWGEDYKGNRDYAQWLNYFSVEQFGSPVSAPVLNPYMRARTGNGESDLQGRGSAFPGGHLDAIDVRYVVRDGVQTSIICNESSSVQNMMREAFEEMSFFLWGVRFQAFENEGQPNERLTATIADLAKFATLHFEGLLFDNTDNVGRLHLGVVWRLRLKEGVTVGNREKGVDFIPPVSTDILQVKYPGVVFENWTKLAIQYLTELPVDAKLGENILADYVEQV